MPAVPEAFLRHLIHIVAAAALLLSAPALAQAQQQILRDPVIYEQQHFQGQCKTASFGEDFSRQLDINNDGLVDTVINDGAITCDGERGRACNEDGCPHNFYLQVKEGGYFMIATAQIYSYEFVPWYGYKVLVLKMHPRFCERTDSAACEMTVRVKGTKFLTISKK
jgi:hypothetical protein